ncbi:MAG: hypothetical protein FD143_1519 [Ignavibacteria bacterium]|nr:MAG: hypothetical protein FD143_1519 [Ignavibacteria bacterium]KAF0161883.1 MAG: hypothetical protein FD188_477 [Ignavibacteria bacterium]
MEKLFAVNYKLRYVETSDWGAEYIKAENKNQALAVFAKLKKIKTNKFKNANKWEWEEGVWTGEIHSINVVKTITCSHCNGAGIIHL